MASGAPDEDGKSNRGGVEPGDEREPGAAGIEAREALRYALNGEFDILFGVLLVGWIVTTVGTLLLGPGGGPLPGIIGTLLGLAITAVGAVVTLGAIVAVAYKLLVDTRHEKPVDSG